MASWSCLVCALAYGFVPNATHAWIRCKVWTLFDLPLMLFLWIPLVHSDVHSEECDDWMMMDWEREERETERGKESLQPEGVHSKTGILSHFDPGQQMWSKKTPAPPLPLLLHHSFHHPSTTVVCLACIKCGQGQFRTAFPAKIHFSKTVSDLSRPWKSHARFNKARNVTVLTLCPGRLREAQGGSAPRLNSRGRQRWTKHQGKHKLMKHGFYRNYSVPQCVLSLLLNASTSLCLSLQWQH